MTSRTGAPRERRRDKRAGVLVATLALVAVVSSGCVGQRDPTGFGSSVRKDFVAGCVEGYVPASGTDPEAASHKTLCGCIYDEMTDKKTGIDFDEFKSAQSAIRKDPTNPANAIDKLIPEFPKFRKTCEGKVVSGP